MFATKLTVWKRLLIEKESVWYSGSKSNVASERNSARSEMEGILWESGSSKSRRGLRKYRVNTVAMILEWCNNCYYDLL